MLFYRVWMTNRMIYVSSLDHSCDATDRCQKPIQLDKGMQYLWPASLPSEPMVRIGMDGWTHVWSNAFWVSVLTSVSISDGESLSLAPAIPSVCYISHQPRRIITAVDLMQSHGSSWAKSWKLQYDHISYETDESRQYILLYLLSLRGSRRTGTACQIQAHLCSLLHWFHAACLHCARRMSRASCSALGFFRVNETT